MSTVKERSAERRPGKEIIAFLMLAAFFGILFASLPDERASAGIAVDPVTDDVQAAAETADQPMLDFALNLRSASEYSLFAKTGVAERGVAAVTGKRADVLGQGPGGRVGKELSNSIAALRQLPCLHLAAPALTGKTFTAGVYCIKAAELNGSMTVDAEGNGAATFVFLVDGSLNAGEGSAVEMRNGARSGNVFFVAADAAVGSGVELAGAVLASGNVMLGEHASVTERVLALGKVELGHGSAILGGSQGTMRICVDQQLPVSEPNSISNRIFHFVVTGASGPGTAADPVRVAVGQCSKNFSVAGGAQTVTQLNSGTTSGGGTFSGNFELVSVENATPESSSSLGLVNLATRTASVNLATGTSQQLLSLRFTNRRAVTGFIEICKRRAEGPGEFNQRGTSGLSGGDADVQGFFQFTIEDVYSVSQQNPDVRTLQVFTLPPGFCTGPIAITKGDPAPFDIGQLVTTVKVSELPRAGTYFESAEVQPAGRRNGPDVRGSIVSVTNSGADNIIAAPGGGYLEVLVSASATAVDETLITFANRSNPGRLKVCKIAGPGIPVNTYFRFTVTGWGATNAAHPQMATYGPVTRSVDVRAGDPAQGGVCEFVPGFGASPGYDQFQTFVNGTPIHIVENGVSPINTIAQNPGELRVAQIRVFGSTFATTAISGYSPNPDLSPASGRTGRATVVSRASVAEAEFSGFRFNPGFLKVCSRAIAPYVVGNEYAYTITAQSPQIGGPNPGPMYPPFFAAVTISAGAVGSAEGNCSFVNTSSLPGGFLNQGSTVTIALSPSGSASNITCPTCGPGGSTTNLQTRQIVLSGPNGIVAGINSVIFTVGPNEPECRAAARREAGKHEAERPALSCRPNRIDFDGDFKSDPSVYSPTTGNWQIYLSSEPGGTVVSRSFGQSGDLPVPANYDRDFKTDLAVWRPGDGRWYIQKSTGYFEYHQWGEAGDIPQTGDYDGDGSSDLIIFRPSSSTWYIRSIETGQITVIPFGAAGDEPVAADYDHDGRTDLAVFRSGTWYTLESTRGFRITPFGQAGDVPVPADYDGDAASDLAVFRGGTWYTLSSTAYTVRQLGEATDIPVPADYDGDGKFDLAVYRPSTGQWFIRRSALSESVPPIEMGGPGYLPLQAPMRYFLQQ
jgi:hypothetical protein